MQANVTCMQYARKLPDFVLEYSHTTCALQSAQLRAAHPTPSMCARLPYPAYKRGSKGGLHVYFLSYMCLYISACDNEGLVSTALFRGPEM
jgi:hypothetical protein